VQWDKSAFRAIRVATRCAPADLHVVSEILGHSSVAITKDVYGHLVEGQKRAAAELMSAQLLRDIGSQDGSQ
jgi:integrase